MLAFRTTTNNLYKSFLVYQSAIKFLVFISYFYVYTVIICILIHKWLNIGDLSLKLEPFTLSVFLLWTIKKLIFLWLLYHKVNTIVISLVVDDFEAGKCMNLAFIKNCSISTQMNLFDSLVNSYFVKSLRQWHSVSAFKKLALLYDLRYWNGIIFNL